MLHQFNAPRFRLWHGKRVGTVPVGTIVYLQDGVRALAGLTQAIVTRNPWMVEAWVNRDYPVLVSGKWKPVKIAGGHLAMVHACGTDGVNWWLTGYCWRAWMLGWSAGQGWSNIGSSPRKIFPEKQMPTITQCKVFRPRVRTKLMAECESGSYQHDSGITYVTLHAPVKTDQGRLNTSDQYKITCVGALLDGHALYQYTNDRGEMLFTIRDP